VKRGERTVLAMSIVVASVLLLVVLAVLAFATLLNPIR
jgi:hypothetical protein